MKDRDFLSIVIPAYNEEDTITKTVDELIAALEESGLRYEILVVNDSSKDRTAEKLAELSSRYANFRSVDNNGPNGYGRAVRCGLDHYKGDAAIIVMADGADAPSDVVKFLQALSPEVDCVFGSRFRKDARVENYPLIKRVLNRMGNLLISILLRRNYNDFTNGFKCFRREVIDAIQPLKSEEFNLTIEMSMRSVLCGARFVVLPNDWVDRDGGQSKFKLFAQVRRYLATIVICLLKRPDRLPNR